jgi:hypothetical protein
LLAEISLKLLSAFCWARLDTIVVVANDGVVVTARRQLDAVDREVDVAKLGGGFPLINAAVQPRPI